MKQSSFTHRNAPVFAAAGLFATTLLPACGSSAVERIQNTERATTLWNDSQHLCLEYATAASKLQQQRANIAFPIAGNQPVQLSYESAESLATIYTVSDVLQFGHAALYRLCEAAGNKSIDTKEYAALVRETLRSMNELLDVQLGGSKAASNDRIARVYEHLRQAEETFARSQQGNDLESTTEAEADVFKARRSFTELLRIYGRVDELTPMLATDVGLEQAMSELSQASAKLKAAKEKQAAADKATKAKADADVETANKDVEKARAKLGEAEQKWFAATGIRDRSKHAAPPAAKEPAAPPPTTPQQPHQ